MNIVYVTGNENKAKYFSKMIGIEIPHVAVDVEEIQSLNLREIVEQKARAAYAIVQQPVLVEDTKLCFGALGSLPGPFIKWFLEDIGNAGMCKMLDGFDDRSAVAGAAIAYFDGEHLEIFEKELLGTIAPEPRGTSKFGWDPIFIPEGSKKTRAEMTEAEFEASYRSTKPFAEVTEFLRQLQKLQ